MTASERHMEFHREQDAALQCLMKVLRPCIPADWDAATFEMAVDFVPHLERRSVRHRLFDPATGREVTNFPESLFAAVTDLHIVFSRYQQAWTRATMELRSSPAQRFGNYELEFEYGRGA